MRLAWDGEGSLKSSFAVSSYVITVLRYRKVSGTKEGAEVVQGR